QVANIAVGWSKSCADPRKYDSVAQYIHVLNKCTGWVKVASTLAHPENKLTNRRMSMDPSKHVFGRCCIEQKLEVIHALDWAISLSHIN
ncbi:MAG: hypothetical protein ACKPKO_58465, partial [Candidatus Fonsibacter sp.]